MKLQVGKSPDLPVFLLYYVLSSTHPQKKEEGKKAHLASTFPNTKGLVPHGATLGTSLLCPRATGLRRATHY